MGRTAQQQAKKRGMASAKANDAVQPRPSAAAQPQPWIQISSLRGGQSKAAPAPCTLSTRLASSIVQQGAKAFAPAAPLMPPGPRPTKKRPRSPPAVLESDTAGMLREHSSSSAVRPSQNPSKFPKWDASAVDKMKCKLWKWGLRGSLGRGP